MENKIKASELIKQIAEQKPVAEVENDSDCYMVPQGEIEVDDDGSCKLVVHSASSGCLDMGNFAIEICGVMITVSRGIDGPEDDYRFEGNEIEYDLGLQEADVITSIKEHVKFPPLEDFLFRYNDTDSDLGDVEESVEVDEDAVYAKDENDGIYCFYDESEVPDDFEVIDAEDAVSRLVELWSDDGGEVS